MAQYTAGTVSIDSGTDDVTLVDGNWTGLVQPGDQIFFNDDVVGYEIETVPTGITLTITSNYPTTLVDVPYVIVTDFTPQLGLPLLNASDQKTTEIYNRAMKLIDSATRGGLSYIDEYADADARDAAISSPNDLDFVYLIDSNNFYVYTGVAWRLWDVTGVNPGPAGLNGGIYVPGFINTTQLRFEYPDGVFTDPVELKGEKGNQGGLIWAGAWVNSIQYEVNDVVSYSNGKNYVSTQVGTNKEPTVHVDWADYWDVFLEPFTSGGTLVGTTTTFNNASLTTAGHLEYSDAIGSRPVQVTITDGDGKEVGPNVDQSAAGVVDVDFSTWGTLIGTWKILATGIAP